MQGFITDKSNDFMLDAIGNIRIESGIEAYRQHIYNALRLQQYEYPYDLTAGINWLGYVLGKDGNLDVWQSQVLNIVQDLEFVRGIKEWRYDIENNNLLFRLVVDTDLGEITIEG